MATYFTKEHEWLKVDGETGTMGLTAYAVIQLGDITFVDLPDPGDQVKQMEVMCTVESVKAVSDIYAPVSGEITDVNGQLGITPELMNKSPEDEAWLVKIRLSDTSELGNLLDRAGYDAFVKELD